MLRDDFGHDPEDFAEESVYGFLLAQQADVRPLAFQLLRGRSLARVRLAAHDVRDTRQLIDFLDRSLA